MAVRRYDGSTLVTRVDASSDAARIGTDQVRKVRFAGTQLLLTPPPREHDGFNEHRELTWERIA
jgi:hypothetical protein